VAVLDLDIHDRSTVSAWDDEAFVTEVRQAAALGMPFATLMGQVSAGFAN
jgi:hypothetical protein